MKIILFALFAILILAPLGKAQDSMDSNIQAPQPGQESAKGSITGRVSFEIYGRVRKQFQSEISVVDDSGQKMIILIRPSTVITSKNGQKLTHTDLKEGLMVNVDYTRDERGIPVADSINLLE